MLVAVGFGGDGVLHQERISMNWTIKQRGVSKEPVNYKPQLQLQILKADRNRRAPTIMMWFVS